MVLYYNLWTSFWKSWADSAFGEDKHTNDTIVREPAGNMTQGTPYPHLTDVNVQNRTPEADPDWCARTEFLANMNHDLRTPLNAVIGFAQIIESEIYGKISPQYLEYAKHIQESGFDLLGKIEELLKLAEAEKELVAREFEESRTMIQKTRQLAIAE